MKLVNICSSWLLSVQQQTTAELKYAHNTSQCIDHIVIVFGSSPIVPVEDSSDSLLGTYCKYFVVDYKLCVPLEGDGIIEEGQTDNMHPSLTGIPYEETAFNPFLLT